MQTSQILIALASLALAACSAQKRPFEAVKVTATIGELVFEDCRNTLRKSSQDLLQDFDHAVALYVADEQETEGEGEAEADDGVEIIAWSADGSSAARIFCGSESASIIDHTFAAETVGQIVETVEELNAKVVGKGKGRWISLSKARTGLGSELRFLSAPDKLAKRVANLHDRIVRSLRVAKKDSQDPALITITYRSR